jgi:hypothetical protein
MMNMKSANEPEAKSITSYVTGYMFVPNRLPITFALPRMKSAPVSTITKKYTFFTVSRRFERDEPRELPQPRRGAALERWRWQRRERTNCRRGLGRGLALLPAPLRHREAHAKARIAEGEDRGPDAGPKQAIPEHLVGKRNGERVLSAGLQ